jgi:hypothetical protein
MNNVVHVRGFTLHNCDANIYFNHKRVYDYVIPNYISIQVSDTYPTSKFTQKRTKNLRIKDEIQFFAEKGGLSIFVIVTAALQVDSPQSHV